MLESLLEDAREALLTADFDRLAELTEQTESALETALPADPSTLLRLRARAEENAGLIEAAARGIAAARRPAAQRESFSTYDAHGRRAQISAPRNGGPHRL